MTELLDATTLALLEEHVRRFLHAMGVSAALVRCRVVAAQSVEVTSADDGLLRNAALEGGNARRATRGSQWAHLTIDIEAGPEGRRLIGTQGAHLEALQHLVRAILRRHLEQNLHITVDVNGYRARREEALVQLAHEAAQAAVASGRTVELKPMGASDRRAVHTALVSRGDVTTESQGEEPRRRVVVRPVRS